MSIWGLINQMKFHRDSELLKSVNPDAETAENPPAEELAEAPASEDTRAMAESPPAPTM